MLAGVPSGAGQYRFVRVIRVLIFPGTRSCVGFVLAAKVLVSHHYRLPRDRAVQVPWPCGTLAWVPRCTTARRSPGEIDYAAIAEGIDVGGDAVQDHREPGELFGGNGAGGAAGAASW